MSFAVSQGHEAVTERVQEGSALERTRTRMEHVLSDL
jgi:hypothetical protein